jgi:hypothetical protein
MASNLGLKVFALSFYRTTGTIKLTPVYFQPKNTDMKKGLVDARCDLDIFWKKHYLHLTAL